MPRAHRHFLPGHVWHITHRCHKQEFLLKFARDRNRWRHWLFEARKRFGLCVLNYIATSNHVHLLVLDTGDEVIAQSMQLIAGRTAQEFNQRKQRKGAFWEDRYHATAIDTDAHLIRCLIYIDLNMVRAGVVTHPSGWVHSGYHDIQYPPSRKSILDLGRLQGFCQCSDLPSLQTTHRQWVETELARRRAEREPIWTESVAVGSRLFVTSVQAQLGVKTSGRACSEQGDTCYLKEDAESYRTDFAQEKADLGLESGFFWDDNCLESVG